MSNINPEYLELRNGDKAYFVPYHTASDANKVLGVNSNNALEWGSKTAINFPTFDIVNGELLVTYTDTTIGMTFAINNGYLEVTY